VLDARRFEDRDDPPPAASSLIVVLTSGSGAAPSPSPGDPRQRRSSRLPLLTPDGRSVPFLADEGGGPTPVSRRPTAAPVDGAVRARSSARIAVLLTDAALSPTSGLTNAPSARSAGRIARGPGDQRDPAFARRRERARAICRVRPGRQRRRGWSSSRPATARPRTRSRSTAPRPSDLIRRRRWPRQSIDPGAVGRHPHRAAPAPRPGFGGDTDS
jgi:hypothetical protein